MQPFNDTVTDKAGNSLADAYVTVRTLLGALAVIYSDDVGTVKSNPFLTDELGKIQFFAANGHYSVGVRHAAFNGGLEIITPVILNDPVTVDLSTKLDKLAQINATKTANFSLTTDMLGKTIPITAAVNATLPDVSGFPEGWQCVLWNLSATAVDVTLVGTYRPASKKIAQDKSCIVRVINGAWCVSGGLS